MNAVSKVIRLLGAQTSVLAAALIGCGDYKQIVVSGGGGAAGLTSAPGGSGAGGAAFVPGLGGMAGSTLGSAGDAIAEISGSGGADSESRGAGASGSAGASGTGGNGNSVLGRSPGCGHAQQGTKGYVEQPRVTIAGLDRTYFLRVPAGYDAGRAYPLIFRWHGAGSNALDGGISIESASKEDAIVVSANGHDTPFGNGWDFSAEGPDVKLFDSLLDSISQNYCVDLDRVYSYGFSMGGGFSLILGCVRGDKLRAIAPIEGGWLPPAEPPKTCVGHVATWVVQGSRDTVVTKEHAANIRDTVFLPQNGCSLTSHSVAPDPCKSFDACMEGYPEVWCETNADHNPQTGFAPAGAWAFWTSLPAANIP